MKRAFQSLSVLLFITFSAFSQTNLKTAELISPISSDGKFKPGSVRANCFSFADENIDCRKVSDVYYENLRSSNDWDWFQAMGDGSRNRIKSLGRKEWTDDFKVPVLEPYAKLKNGEQRLIVIGENNDNRLPEFSRIEAQSSSIFPNDLAEAGNISRDLRRASPKSNYKPFEKAILGNMYVMRVVDENNDFYVLFRVDELERGTRCKISWKKIPAPEKD